MNDEPGYYLIYLGGGEVLRCPGTRDQALEHLRQIRREHIAHHQRVSGCGPESAPWLIGHYPADTIGGPKGRDGVHSYGYTPTRWGLPGQPRAEWSTTPPKERDRA